MKKTVVSLLTALGLCTSSTAGNKITLLPPDDFISAAGNDSLATILDVRRPEEFAEGHVKGAVLLDVLNEATFDEGLKKLDKARHYYVYCRSGKRSHIAAIKMLKQGFTVVEMEGGFLNWTNCGLPVEK